MYLFPESTLMYDIKGGYELADVTLLRKSLSNFASSQTLVIM